MMTKVEVLQLHTGDEVYWNDPDAGLCSRFICICEIEILEEESDDPVARIMGRDGDELECYASELT